VRPPTTRTIQVGGRTGEELLRDLSEAGVNLNEHAKTLLLSDHFTATNPPQTVDLLLITVRDLGFADGATLPEILQQAQNSGLKSGPIDLAPHFRLQYLDQPDGEAGPPGKAAPGSITVASAPISPTVPRGFYLRAVSGELWLRGYRSDDDHLWDPEDRFAFITMGG
jgi:hypothetical protein